MVKKKAKTNSSGGCGKCNAMCCRYVATGIDAPTNKKDYDHIRWYLLHKHVHVFKDHEGDWYIEFAADCEQLGERGECLNYDERPRICRRYGEDGASCEFHLPEAPYQVRFSEPAEFEAYLESRGIDWRWKRP